MASISRTLLPSHLAGKNISHGTTSNRISYAGKRPSNGNIVCSYASNITPEPQQQVPSLRLDDFTRFVSDGKNSELQTSVVTYWKWGKWWDVFGPAIQVDLVAAVHIADKEYFDSLQEDLLSYDRVLYELVADKSRQSTVNGREERWRPPKPSKSKRRGGIVGNIQRSMSSLLDLEFQLECIDYSGDSWYHADLDLDTFKKLQEERGETMLYFFQSLLKISTTIVNKNVPMPENSDPFQRGLIWGSRFVPMPLFGLFLIQSVCCPPEIPLLKTPEVRALLDLDLSRALKIILAKQITDRTVNDATQVFNHSVIVGERNKAAIKCLSEALDDGCKKIAIFYGSGHLPDLDERLRTEFGLKPVEVKWRTAWAISGTDRTINQDSISRVLAKLAKISGWPLNRYQTTAILLFSVVLALDLCFWEALLKACEGGLVASIEIVTGFLDRGWGL